MKAKDVFKIISIPVVVASLCCLSPVILVLFGLSTVSFAASLSNNLYSNHKWIFRIVGLFFLVASLVFYLRRQKGICTFDEAKKRRNEILNIILISIGAAVTGYIIWLYIVVEYIGKLLHIWK